MRPSPATFRLMPGVWALPAVGSISDKAAPCARDRIGLSAWCGSASERAGQDPLYRFGGLSAWRAVATSSTAEGHLDPRLTNDDRDGGLPDRESPAAPGSSPPKRALPPLPCWPRPTVRLTPTPDRPSRKGKSAAGRAQSPAGWRKPRPPPSDKAVRAGVDKVPPCRIAPPFRWPGEWAGCELASPVPGIAGSILFCGARGRGNICPVISGRRTLPGNHRKAAGGCAAMSFPRRPAGSCSASQ